MAESLFEQVQGERKFFWYASDDPDESGYFFGTMNIGVEFPDDDSDE